VPGELYIGGDGLAQGYWQRPALTAAAFVPSPFHPGTRLYRTGDKARILASGLIEFLGRQDDQVKVRGFRVEPGEIQTLLLEACPFVEEAFVTTATDQADVVRLVAYVVLRPAATSTTSEIRTALKARLPEYMVPSAVVPLASLPLTRNGKVDRAALRTPDWGQASAATAWAAPETDTERAVAAVWQEVLQAARVGRFDNFFDLGGYSLAAVRAVALLEDRLGVRLNPKQMIFQTLAQIAAVCDSLRVEPAAAPELAPAGVGGVLRGFKKIVAKITPGARRGDPPSET
jgi:hypothetical protein